MKDVNFCPPPVCPKASPGSIVFCYQVHDTYVLTSVNVSVNVLLLLIQSAETHKFRYNSCLFKARHSQSAACLITRHLFSRREVLRTQKTAARSSDIHKVTSQQCVGDFIDSSTKEPFHRSRRRAGVKE